MRHVVDLLLGVVDRGDNRCRELLEDICEAVLLGRSLAGTGTGLGLGGDAAVWIEAAERAVALL